MADALDQLTDAVLAIQSDSALKQRFLDILSIGSYSQQIRVHKLLEVLEPLNPPDSVMTAVRLMENDKLAHAVYNQLKSH